MKSLRLSRERQRAKVTAKWDCGEGAPCIGELAGIKGAMRFGLYLRDE